MQCDDIVLPLVPDLGGDAIFISSSLVGTENAE